MSARNSTPRSRDKARRIREAARRCEHKQQKHAVAASGPGCRASESERHCQPRSSCRVPLRRTGCRECAGLWNGRQFRRNICARVDCIARSKSARPGADRLWDPPGRRTLRHATCSKVVTCFARLGLAELMRSVVPTGRRLADRQALHRGSSARRAVALEAIFPRVGSSKDNALWQSLGHIRCMERVGGSDASSPDNFFRSHVR